MNRILSSALSACLLVAGGAAMLAVSPQDRTQQPGQPTQGKVWIQNRGDTEAVPVVIENTASAMPLRVVMTGVQTVEIRSESVVQTRVVRQAWEYRDVRIPASQNPSAVLNNAGTDGWETTGVAFTDPGGAVVVMKRPR